MAWTFPTPVCVGDTNDTMFVVSCRPDTSHIMVYVGYGFYVEFTLSEALKFIEKKVSHLTKSSEELTKQATKIKAHIKFVIEVRKTGRVKFLSFLL